MKQVIHTDSAPAAIGPTPRPSRSATFSLSPARCHRPQHRRIVEGDIKAQAQQSLNNLKAILNAAGTNMGAVVKTTVFLADMNDFAAMNEVYAQFFQEPSPPAPPSRWPACPRTPRWRSRPSLSCKKARKCAFPLAILNFV